MVRIGVICPSEIAFRRFMPALAGISECKFIGIGVNKFEERFHIDESHAEDWQREVMRKEEEKAEKFVLKYGGRIFHGYEEIISSPQIDAVYVPLPPALHYVWAMKALENGKHVLVEKPASLTLTESSEMIRAASDKGLALHENYMFAFHSQLTAIEEYINNGELGDIRLIRIAFGFPKRPDWDFRYDKNLGGGALIDCGGYTIRYASMLLGDSARIVQAMKNSIEGYEVDMYGSGVLVNDEGITAHIAFGMDNDYRCELEVWGSKGTLYTGRVLTAPAGYIPNMTVSFNGRKEEIQLPQDDAFRKSILHFLKCIDDAGIRKKTYGKIIKQAGYIDEFNRKVYQE